MDESGKKPYHELLKQRRLEIRRAEPLPPTKITELARKKLEAWGLTYEEIEIIRHITSQFRYDLCPEKVARLSQIPVEVFNREGIDFANLPAFYDIRGRLDGQCADIGKQWIIQINASKLLQILNQRIKYRVFPAYHTGLSESHFCKVGSDHVWNGLVLVDENDNIIDEIFIDAAFQNIHSKEETKYVQKTPVYNPKSIESIENAEVPLGWVEINGHSWSGNTTATAVIGASSDFEFVYALGFLRDRQTGVIKPVLKRIFYDGSKVYFIIGNENQILTTSNAITPSEQDHEVERILREAQKISYVEKAPTVNKVTWTRDDSMDS